MISLGALVALALALALATGSTAATALADKRGSQSNVPIQNTQAPSNTLNASQEISGATKISGVITDSICKGKHDMAMNQSASACTKVCLKKGGKYVLVDGDNVYVLQGQTAYLDRFAGERVTITGVLAGETIKIDSVQGGQP